MRRYLPAVFVALLALTATWVLATFPPYHGDSAPSGGKVTQYISGNICVAASSGSAGTCGANVDGTAGFTGPGTGLTGTATKFSVSSATALSGGAANQLPYQSAPNVTSFLGALTNGQFIIGATGAAPAPGTITNGGGLTVTPTANGITLTVLANGTPQPAWQGINYASMLSSAAAVADSTATFSFNVEAFTAVFGGNSFSVNKQNFAVPASTYTLVSWNPTNGFRQWGIKDLMPPSVSSYTAVIGSDLAVSLSSTDANGNMYFFDSLNMSPLPTAFYSGGNSTNFTGVSANGQAVPFYNCRVNGIHSMASCDDNTIAAFSFNGRTLQVGPLYIANSFPHKWCFVANNTSGGTATAQLYDANGSANSTWVTVNGAPGTVNSSEGTAQVNVNLPTGYFNACLYLNAAATGLFIPTLKLPANVAYVRPGEW